jgi:hypothetical protein
VGLRGSRMGTKENDFKSGKTVFIGMLRKKLKHTVFQKYFFLEIPINVKACRVKRAPGKYITGAALDRPALNCSNRRCMDCPESTCHPYSKRYGFAVYSSCQLSVPQHARSFLLRPNNFAFQSYIGSVASRPGAK